MAMMENLPTGSIAAALRFMAFEKKLSQTKLADEAGMSQSAVNRRLSGETDLTLDDLDHLAKALGKQVRVTFVEAAMEAAA